MAKEHGSSRVEDRLPGSLDPGVSRRSSGGGRAFGTALVLLQRWPRFALMGLPTFFGTFMAVFTQLEFRHLGWVLLIALAAGWSVVLVQVLACPREATIVRGTFRAFDRASEELLGSIATLLAEAPGEEKARRRVRHATSRMEMLALHLDGRLASPLHGLSTRAVDELHLRVFDREAALGGLANAALDHDAARQAGGAPLIAEVSQVLDQLTRDEVVAASSAIAGLVEQTTHDLATAPLDAAARTAHRVVTALDDVARTWRTDDVVTAAIVLRRDGEAPADPVFEAAITLEATGGLPGTAGPAARLHADRPPVLGFDAPIFQRAVRMAIALSAASAIGYWIASERWYYAMFGAFSVMMSATGTAEHVRIGIERALGTAVGAVVAVSLVDTFAGHLVWTYVVLFLLVGLAFYFQRPSDTLSTFGLTVMVAFLYLQMNTYEDIALWDRVFETAAGGAVAVLVAVFVFPLPTGRITRAAADHAFTGLAEALGTAGEVVTGRQPVTALRPAARRAQQAAWTFGESVGSAPYVRAEPDGPSSRDIQLLAALGNDTARLARDLELAGPFAASQRRRVEASLGELRTSVEQVGAWRAGARPRPTIRRCTSIDELGDEVRASDAAPPLRAARLAVVHDLHDIETHLVATAGLEEEDARVSR